jgi:predicted negative regulator of RcsB-dependent stress response
MKTSHIVIAVVVIAAAYFGYTYWMKKKTETADTSKDVKEVTKAAPVTTDKKAGGFDGSLSQMMGV